MQNHIKVKTTTLFTVTAFCTVLSLVLRTLSFLFFYDAEAGYYARGAALPMISNCSRSTLMDQES